MAQKVFPRAIERRRPRGTKKFAPTLESISKGYSSLRNLAKRKGRTVKTLVSSHYVNLRHHIMEEKQKICAKKVKKQSHSHHRSRSRSKGSPSDGRTKEKSKTKKREKSTHAHDKSRGTTNNKNTKTKTKTKSKSKPTKKIDKSAQKKNEKQKPQKTANDGRTTSTSVTTPLSSSSQDHSPKTSRRVLFKKTKLGVIESCAQKGLNPRASKSSWFVKKEPQFIDRVSFSVAKQKSKPEEHPKPPVQEISIDNDSFFSRMQCCQCF